MKNSTLHRILLRKGLLLLAILFCVPNSNADDGVLRLALPRSPLELDPYSYLSLQEWYVHHNITATLVELNQENQIIPGLATNFQVVNDGKTYRFNLSDRGRWSDGTSITPTDILASLQSKDRHNNAQLLPKLLRAGPIEKAILLDGRTLVIHLSAPYPGLLFQLATPEYGIVDPNSFRVVKRLSSESKTSGDYRISELTAERLVLIPSPSGRIKSANPQKIEFTRITKQPELLEAVRSGRLDFIESQSDDVLSAAKESGKYQIHNGGLDNLATLQARKLSPDQWRSFNVLLRFLDKTNFLEQPRRPAKHLVSMSIAKAGKEPKRLSIAEARSLLGATPASLELELGQDATSDQQRDSAVLQQEAKKLGIDLKLRRSADFRTRWENEDFSLALVRMGVYAENESELLHGYFCTGFSPYKSIEPIVCDSIKEANLLGLSPQVAADHLTAAYAALFNSKRIVPLYHFPRRFLVAKKWSTNRNNFLVPFPRFINFVRGSS